MIGEKLYVKDVKKNYAKKKKSRNNEVDTNRQIQCCWWVFDKENKCYHTQCGHDYSFNTNGRGGFCMYCGRVNVVSNVEEINEWLGISN